MKYSLILTLHPLHLPRNPEIPKVHSGVSMAMCNPGPTHTHPSSHPSQVSRDSSQESWNCSLQCRAQPLECREENQGMLCTCRSPIPRCPVLPSSTEHLLGRSVHPKAGGMSSSALSCLLVQWLGSSCSNSLDSSPLFQDAPTKPSLFWDVFENRAMDLNKTSLIINSVIIVLYY